MRQFACRRRKKPSLFQFSFFTFCTSHFVRRYAAFSNLKMYQILTMKKENLPYIQKFYFLTALTGVWHVTHFYLYEKYRNLGPISPVLPLCMQSHLNMSFFNCHLHLQMVHLISNWHILTALLMYSLWLIPVERK